MIQQANDYLDKKQYKKAINAYLLLKNINSHDSLLAYEGLEKAYIQTRQDKKAEEICLKAIELDPTNPRFYVKLAYIKSRLGNIEESFMLAKKAFDMNSELNEVQSCWGVTLCEYGKYDEAIPIIQQAIQKNPSDAWWLHQYLSKCFSKIGKKELADKEAYTSFRLKPGIRALLFFVRTYMTKFWYNIILTVLLLGPMVFTLLLRLPILLIITVIPIGIIFFNVYFFIRIGDKRNAFRQSAILIFFLFILYNLIFGFRK